MATALDLLDAGLALCAGRELMSANEVSDLLLDVRSAIHPTPDNMEESR